jgi:beta-mannosidase
MTTNTTETVDLNGQWRLRYGAQTAEAPTCPAELEASDWPEIDATVPGNVELDLLAAGVIDDPEVGQNCYRLRKYETFDWWYRRTFTAPADAAGRKAELVFEGLDCMATVWLNGEEVGWADNMLVAHRFDVNGALRPGPNELVVHLESALLEGRRHVPDAYEHAMGVNWESLSVRKAPHMYGWDIMPRLVSAGIWRGVRLELPAAMRIGTVYWATLAADPAARTARLLVDWEIDTERLDLDPLRVRVSMRRCGGGREVHVSEHAVFGTHGRAALNLKDVDLWWPRGAGEPALHDIAIELLEADGTVVDRRTGRVGLRTIELVRTDITTPERPGEFVFVVNGVKIFVKGTNWVPLDALHSRDRHRVAGAVELVAQLNCNMVRCWGGNVYEDHDFFDLCDERGIMVWQDFAMACAIYPQTDSFAHTICREGEAVVRKLRNHASLALWSGNNEIDECFEWAGTRQDPNTDRLSRQVLADVVRRLDPTRPYLPSSPYYSPEFVRRGCQRQFKPEDHLWGPRDDFKGPFYLGSQAHFVSEIGYHGCPGRRSLERMMGGPVPWPAEGDELWRAKAVCPHPNHHDYDYRIALMGKQVAVLFGRVPDGLDDFTLASQIVQAEAMKFFLDRWRSGKWRRTGMLWWNVLDGWPVISDAVVDFYGRRKLAYEYLRRQQADVCAILREAGEGAPGGARQPGRHELVVVNDTLAPASGQVRIRHADSGAELLAAPFAVEANGLVTVGTVPASPIPAMWLIDWTLSDGRPGRSHYLAGPKPMELADYKRWLTKLDVPEEVGP